MVDSILVGAALMVTSSVPARGLLDLPTARPTSLKSGDHVRVQTERRRNTRAAVNGADSLESIMPMIRRAEADNALVNTRDLLDKTSHQIRSGRTEEAMLTIDQAATSLERARTFLPSDARVIDLDFKERDLRLELPQERALGRHALGKLFVFGSCGASIVRHRDHEVIAAQGRAFQPPGDVTYFTEASQTPGILILKPSRKPSGPRSRTWWIRFS